MSSGAGFLLAISHHQYGPLHNAHADAWRGVAAQRQYYTGRKNHLFASYQSAMHHLNGIARIQLRTIPAAAKATHFTKHAC